MVMVQSLQFLVAFSIYWTVIAGMRCEDDYAKGASHSDIITNQQIAKELLDIRMTMKDLSGRPLDDRKPEDRPMFDMRYDPLPAQCESQHRPRNCGEAMACSGQSGYYFIHIKDYGNESVLVECDGRSEGGDWLVIQRRHDGSEDFYRNWQDYRNGFGNVNGEFFIGLEKLYHLTNGNGPQELLILMENATNSAKGMAKYDSFIVGSDVEKYSLKGLGRFTGDRGDALRYSFGMAFSTKDQDNDLNDKSCAQMFLGGWWYKSCHTSNLNGLYGNTEYAKGLNWMGLTDHYSTLKYVKMMIRRRRM